MAEEESVSVLEHVTALMGQMDLRNQQRFDAQTKAIDAALMAAEKAVTKAEISADKRFESVNEFRQTLTDQAAAFITRVEFEGLAERLRELSARQDVSGGKSLGLSSGWAYLVGAVGVVLAIYANTKGG